MKTFIRLYPTVFIMTLINTAVWGILIWLLVLSVRALRKYLSNGQAQQEQESVRRSLGEVLKKLRVERKMTQELVAEHLGVSRQAVSKWENGTSDPSTSNLLALAKLFDISPEELLKGIGL